MELPERFYRKKVAQPKSCEPDVCGLSSAFEKAPQFPFCAPTYARRQTDDPGAIRRSTMNARFGSLTELGA
jgi:hypothetical protein